MATLALGISSGAWAQAAGGQTSVDSDLPRCAVTAGTLAIGGGDEETRGRLTEIQMSSIVPLLRSAVLQSNCFVVTAQANARSKSALSRLKSESGGSDYRPNTKSEKNQQVVSDYYMDPIVNFAGASKDVQQTRQQQQQQRQPYNVGSLQGLLGSRGAQVASGLMALQQYGSRDQNVSSDGRRAAPGRTVTQNGSAQVTLEVYEVKSEVLIATAIGNGTASSTAAVRADLTGASADTPGARAVAAAIDDAYRKIIPAIVNYRAQHVKGGLGNGGRLRVD